MSDARLPKYKEIRELIDMLNEASRAYYATGRSRLNDWEYDSLLELLKKLESETGIICPDSPSQRVGEQIFDANKVAHAEQMFSLKKVKECDSLPKALLAIAKPMDTLVVQHKFDGCSLELLYRGGVLVDALTRGDGVHGRSVKSHVFDLTSIPKVLPVKWNIDVRGEILCDLNSFADYNGKMEKPFKNARNAVAGILGSGYDPQTQYPALFFVAYDCAEAQSFFTTERRMLGKLDEWGFICPATHIVMSHNLDKELLVKFGNEQNCVTSNGLRYQIDGLVVKNNDLKERDIRGTTSTHPRYAFAYKFEAAGEWSTLRAVTWNVSTTGRINPVAVFDPVRIEGADISRATLHNAHWVTSKELRIGDELYIEKINGIIPNIMQHVSCPSGDLVLPPGLCPVCGKETSYSGNNLMCTNIHCPARVVSTIERFCSRSGMNIKSVGSSVIEQMVSAGLISNASDLYKLTNQQLLDAGFSQTKADRIIEEIQISKGAELAHIVYALAIPGIGRDMARSIGQKYFTYDSLRTTTPAKLYNELGMSTVVGRELLEFLSTDVTAVELAKYIK